MSVTAWPVSFEDVVQGQIGIIRFEAKELPPGREVQAKNLRKVADRLEDALSPFCKERNAEVLAERDTLLSAIKQHRNATISRLKLLAGAARQPEPSDLLLKPDQDLYEAAEKLPGYEKGRPEGRPFKDCQPTRQKGSTAAA